MIPPVPLLASRPASLPNTVSPASPALLAQQAPGDQFTSSVSAPQFAGKTKRLTSEERQAANDRLLMRAIKSRKLGAVRKAIESGANVNADFTRFQQDFKPEPDAMPNPLMLAFSTSPAGDLRIIDCLLNHGADFTKDLDKIPFDGMTALHLAAAYGDPKKIDAIMKHPEGKALLNKPSKGLGTPLQTAMMFNRLEAAKRLLAQGAAETINQISGDPALTPLAAAIIIPVCSSMVNSRNHTAAVQSALDFVDLLLVNGADPAQSPEWCQAIQADFFQDVGQGLDVAPRINAWKKQLGVQELPDAQLKALQKQVRQILNIVKRSSQANIPGVDVELITKRLNKMISRSNVEATQIRKLGGTDRQVRDILGLVRPILYTGLPLDPDVLKEYADLALKVKYTTAAQDAALAGARNYQDQIVSRIRDRQIVFVR